MLLGSDPALHRAREVREYQDILRSTVGIAFLGTPFQGSNEHFYTVTQLRIAVAIWMGGAASDELVKYLRNDASGRGQLDEVIQRFCEMIEDSEFKIAIVCFYETQPTDFTKVVCQLPPQFVKQLDNAYTGIVSFPSYWLGRRVRQC
ncbi:hypothetical protein CDD83_8168 [Cordyceps sp. RAO-2017]|nr:hypothetical protein CDD83_8168 [Cordyceps sp. RAO-2017]